MRRNILVSNTSVCFFLHHISLYTFEQYNEIITTFLRVKCGLAGLICVFFVSFRCFSFRFGVFLLSRVNGKYLKEFRARFGPSNMQCMCVAFVVLCAGCANAARADVRR